MSAQAPAFRRDLETSLQETAGRKSFVVKDPATGRYYRFGEAEHVIITQLDGETPLEVVRRRAEAHFGGVLDEATVNDFIESLRRRGLLVPRDGEAALAPPRRGRVQGSLLYLRLKAFDPDRLLDRLVGKVRVFFTAYFVVLSVAAVVAAVGVLAANSGEVGRDLLGILKPETVPVALLVILATTVAHEFAHGLTCKHFGGKVHEMGFLLLYFQPALYCNVSDAWLFPEKSRRLWVTFAGGWFELFLWALAVLTWRVTAPETAFNYVALVIMASSGIRVLFNFNPFIKLDGYYLLSDWLEVPNLRRRSFTYLKGRIRRLWRATSTADDEVPARERRIYLAYGLLAGGFTFLLLGFIGSRIAGFLVERFQGWGFLVFTVLLVLIFRHPVGRLLKMAFRVRFPVAKGGLGVTRRRVAGLLVLVAVPVVLFFGRMELTVSGEFTVLPAHNADVRAELEAILKEVYVAEGDSVEAGQPVARLSDREYRSERNKVQAQIRGKHAELKMLLAGSTAEETAVARQEVETARTSVKHARGRYGEAKRVRLEHLGKARSTVGKAEERLRYAGSERDQLKPLLAAGAVSRADFDAAEQEASVRQKELEEAQAELKMVLADDLAEVRTDIAVGEKELKQAEARLDVLLAGTRPEEIEAIEAEIAGLEAQRRYIDEQLGLVEVVSPISGVVTTPNPKEKVGELVEKGDLILEVCDFRTVRVEIYVPEKEIGDVELGQEIVLKARAYPGDRFQGTVTAIAPTAMAEEEGLRRKIVRVTTQIDNAALLLKPEMTGYAKIYSGERRVIDILTRRLVRFLRVEFWSWW